MLLGLAAELEETASAGTGQKGEVLGGTAGAVIRPRDAPSSLQRQNAAAKRTREGQSGPPGKPSKVSKTASAGQGENAAPAPRSTAAQRPPQGAFTAAGRLGNRGAQLEGDSTLRPFVPAIPAPAFEKHSGLRVCFTKLLKYTALALRRACTLHAADDACHDPHR